MWTISFIIATLLAIVVGAYVFRAVVVPAVIYLVQYARYGKTQAETDALEAMGENKLSYGLKSTIESEFSSDPNVKGVQKNVADALGGAFGKGGVAEPLGQGVSGLGSAGEEQNEGKGNPVGGAVGAAGDTVGAAGGAVGGAANSVGGALGGLTGQGGEEKKRDGGEGQKRDGGEGQKKEGGGGQGGLLGGL